MNPDIIGSIEPQFWQILLRTVVTFGIGIFFIKIADKLIFLFFQKVGTRSALSSYRVRIRTIHSSIQGIVRGIIFVFILLIIASDLEFNILPFLTGASILGLAVSFGAQTLIRDIISGFFLLLDNTVNVGDHVKIADSEGEIISITLRTITLKDKKGNIIFIPNSEVKKIIVYKEK